MQPIIGFTAATLSATALWLAESIPSIPPETRGWVEVGGTIGLIGGLSFACSKLWSEIQKMRDEQRTEREAHRLEISELNEEIRIERRDQNNALIEALNQIRRN